MSATRVERLRCAGLRDPLGLDAPSPLLTWNVLADRRGARQIAYRVLVASTEEALRRGEGDLWDSGVVASDVGAARYDGATLGSRTRASWSVTVWDEQEQATTSHTAGSWETGLLEESDWAAQWMASPAAHEPSGVVSFRTTVHVPAPVIRARTYATALGVYELRVAGRPVGPWRLAPGWTDYRTRLHYQVLDCTELLVEGDNDLELLLAEGWYAGYVGFLGQREHYGSTPEVLAQLEITTTQGTTRVASGPDWQCSSGPLVSSDLLRGEAWDLGRTAQLLGPSRLSSGTAVPISTSAAPPVVVLEERPASSVIRTGPDTHLVDLGQNLTGWLRLRLSGPLGTTVTVRHAEVLGPDGTLYTDNLRAASATDTYVLSGGDDLCEPRFTFHGFRYAEVSGWPADLPPTAVLGIVCGSDVEQVGTFRCGDPRIERLHENVVWSARGNFLDVPTDCPQRDERMGWTGDAQVFAPTALALFDVGPFFAKWLQDLRDTQTPDGSFCDVAPRVVLGEEGSAGWADAGVLVPWLVADRYGDDAVLEVSYPSMRAWVDYLHRHNPERLWLHKRGYDNGDWLHVDAETDKDLLATLYLARTTRVTGWAAMRLGRLDEAHELDALADEVQAALRAAFVLPDGRLKSETQTAYALALAFEVLPEDLRPRAAEHLVNALELRGRALSTGFLGTPHLLPALTAAGRSDLAYALLLREQPPSWLHEVVAGATTMWERWDGWTGEAGFQDPAMNSFNHYAFGAVGEWLHSGVAGVRPARGGREAVIAPLPHPALGWAEASQLLPTGRLTSSWRLEGDLLQVDVEVPVGTVADVVLPAEPAAAVREGGKALVAGQGVLAWHHGPDQCRVQVESGSYAFTVTPAPARLTS